jgi:CheY-like chemotaxis protein
MANVLIVDDSSDTVALSAELLEAAGHCITTGFNGEEGLKSGRNDLPEVAGRMGTPYFLRKASSDYGEALLHILDRALRERRAPSAA